MRRSLTFQPLQPIQTVELFPGLSAQLLSLLKSLPNQDWELPSACPGWTVRDVAAHLLGGTLGRLANGRDRLARRHSEGASPTFDELVAIIDRYNAEWVSAARRLSPRLLVDFLELTDPQLSLYFKALPPFEPARIGVLWAGEAHSLNWFDIAREYTEKWLHQQHIREAVGAPLLLERGWLFPVLDSFLRALPHAYREVEAIEGAAVHVQIVGAAGGDWTLLRQGGGWVLYSGAASEAAASVRMGAEVAWRLFTKGLDPLAAREQVQIEGDRKLGEVLLGMVAIMA
jgi:uncharacterized protein (TIGR03083 family)